MRILFQFNHHTLFLLKEARCVGRQASGAARYLGFRFQPYPLVDLSDPCKTQSTVGIVLRIDSSPCHDIGECVNADHVDI